jgi:tetratricopeptide (TPR) repeat protein
MPTRLSDVSPTEKQILRLIRAPSTKYRSTMNFRYRLTATYGLLLLLAACTPPAVSTTRPIAASTSVPAPVQPKCDEEPTAAEKLIREADRIQATSFDEALALYKEAETLEPKNARIQYRIGTIYRKKEEWANAASSFQRAANLAPSFANFWYEYGYALTKMAELKSIAWDDARKPLAKCIEIDNNFADCHYRLGLVFVYLDEERKALESYTNAIVHDPTKINRYTTLADLYLRLDFSTEAESVLQQAKAFSRPADRSLYGVHVLLADIYQSRGASAEALTELEAAKVVVGTEGPEAVLILFILGSAYATSTPPRRLEAIANLKGFSVRACTQSKRAIFATECDIAQTLISRLGGTVP